MLLSVALSIAHGALASVPALIDPPDEARYINAPVPDVMIRTAEGNARLSSLWRDGPVLLTLVFSRCSGVCSPYLRELRRADEALGQPSDVRRVVLSFDRRDTVEDMRESAEHLGVRDRPGWLVGVADPDEIAALAHALGFWSAWDQSRQQFDHPAMLAGLRKGRVARLLVGETVTPARLGEVIREARGEFVASYPLPGQARFRCFEYNGATGRVTLAWSALLMVLPAFGAITVTLVLFGRAQRGSKSAV
jgi:cytochrome oxidase Cu insertion factor (SCO1/SenC/PrrC family)